MTGKIFILNPSAPVQNAVRQTRRTLDGLKGKVVGFVDNSKPNFNHLVEDLGELMVSKFGVKKLVKHRKHLASISASDAAMDDLQKQCDLVITGSGD